MLLKSNNNHLELEGVKAIICENLLSLFEIQSYFNKLPLKNLTDAQNNANLFKVRFYFFKLKGSLTIV